MRYYQSHFYTLVIYLYYVFTFGEIPWIFLILLKLSENIFATL